MYRKWQAVHFNKLFRDVAEIIQFSNVTWHHWGSYTPPPPKILVTPKFRFPVDTKALGLPLIYLVGLLTISDPHINICVRPPNT